MKHYFTIGCALCLTMCATLSPEQEAERRMRWSRVATGALVAGFNILGGQPLPADQSFRK